MMMQKGTIMLDIRRAHQRGHAQHGWLDSFHTFSFAEYRDPQQMGWGALRVINDDTVQPAEGFGTHGHRDMEIISYVLEGALAHQDSMGNGSVLRPDQVQMMHAGTGVTHSEFNHSTTDPVHFLQIWILPKFRGAPSGYQETTFSKESKQGKLCLLASPTGENNSLTIGQDVKLFATCLHGDDTVEYTLPDNHLAYVHVAKGKVILNGQDLQAGDGVKIQAESLLTLSHGIDAEVLLFDLL